MVIMDPDEWRIIGTCEIISGSILFLSFFLQSPESGHGTVGKLFVCCDVILPMMGIEGGPVGH